MLIDKSIVFDKFDGVSGASRSGGFGDFAGLDAGRADLHPARATLGRFHANRLQVWIEATWGAIVRVRDIIAELRALAADFTTFGHIVFCYLRNRNQGL